MAKKKRSQTFNDIVQLLKTGSYNILQIAKKTGINWETAKNAIETLSKINLISSQKKNNKTYYTIDESKFLDFRNDTLLGLPLKPEQETTTKKLLTAIQKRWNKIFPKRILRKTFHQKMLIELIKKQNIKNVPFGWYLFGQCVVLHEPELQDITPITKYNKEIDIIITEYGQIPNTKELLEKHYLEEGNELYLSKIKIVDILLNSFNEESLISLKRNLKQFVFSFSKTEENTEIISSLNGFYSLIIRLINSYNERELEDLRPLIYEAFNSLWKLIATCNLYQSLLENGWYEKTILYKYYILRAESLQSIADNYLSALEDHCPPLEIPEDNSLRKFKGTLVSQSQ
jgi:predicted transcriptional regulator